MKAVFFLILVLVTTASRSVELHTGLNGPWHQPSYPGQGLILHIIPDNNQVFIAWFTYTEAGDEQMWLTAQGTLDTQPIELTIYQSTNGQFNGNEPLPEQSVWGTGQISFSSCIAADFSFNGNEGQSGSLDLTRITAPINCSEG